MSGREDVLRGLQGYTRGPWRADRYYVRPKGRDVAISASASAGFTVAETYANTELQARAPALVDEIRELRAFLRKLADMDYGEDDHRDPCEKDVARIAARARDLLPDTPETDDAE